MRYLALLLVLALLHSVRSDELDDTIKCINDYVQTYKSKMVLLRPPSARPSSTSWSRPTPTP